MDRKSLIAKLKQFRERGERLSVDLRTTTSLLQLEVQRLEEKQNAVHARAAFATAARSSKDESARGCRRRFKEKS
jgi:FtsZ-binding cell division protein ZapB